MCHKSCQGKKKRSYLGSLLPGWRLMYFTDYLVFYIQNLNFFLKLAYFHNIKFLLHVLRRKIYLLWLRQTCVWVKWWMIGCEFVITWKWGHNHIIKQANCGHFPNYDVHGFQLCPGDCKWLKVCLKRIHVGRGKDSS